VESVLAAHAQVRAAAVVAREDTPGEKRLVAYLVADGPEPSTAELRAHLGVFLPEYMMPSTFVTLPALPLTPSGKVDRKSLPPPGQNRPRLQQGYAAPQTSRQRALARIWSEVLGVDRVGIHDNFFELGGHSLLAMTLTSRMSAELGRDVPVKLLFLYPSVARLADALNTVEPDGRSALARALPAGDQPSSPYLTIERVPLRPRFKSGELAPVQAAALGYLPSEVAPPRGQTRDQVRSDWFAGGPVVSAVFDTFLGRIALLTLPFFSSELYRDRASLQGAIVEGLDMARGLGARTVSLTGLIPSATDYGRAVVQAAANRRDLPAVSTGHATTAATVVLTVERLGREAERDLSRERVAVLGLGSIGLSALRLMLRVLPHPAEITLCDLYDKRMELTGIRQELVQALRYQGAIQIVESRGVVPPALYEATLIVGATNMPDVLDVRQLGAGTILVDDSTPHCFAPHAAIERLESQGDLLFSDGGVLESPVPISQLRYVPESVESVLSAAYPDALTGYRPTDIAGCVLSSLLSAREDELQPTIGPVDLDACLRSYEYLTHLGFRAAAPHCGSYTPGQHLVDGFRQRFGGGSPGSRVFLSTPLSRPDQEPPEPPR
jgi:predicted amino acid dehydrogenase